MRDWHTWDHVPLTEFEFSEAPAAPETIETADVFYNPKDPLRMATAVYREAVQGGDESAGIELVKRAFAKALGIIEQSGANPETVRVEIVLTSGQPLTRIGEGDPMSS